MNAELMELLGNGPVPLLGSQCLQIPSEVKTSILWLLPSPAEIDAESELMQALAEIGQALNTCP